MTIKTWTNGDVLYAADLNLDYQYLFRTIGCDYIRQLMDRAITYSRGSFDGWAEAYIDSNGRSNSVTTTTCGFNTNRYFFNGFTLTANTDTNSETTKTTDVISTTVTCSALSNLIITNVKAQAGGSGTRTFSVEIKVGTETLASKNSSAGTYNITPASIDFTKNDYTRPIKTSETFTITTSVVGGSTDLENLSAQSFTGSYFSFSNQTINGSSGTAVTIVGTQVTLDTSEEITHLLPGGTFSPTISSAIGVPLISHWETGADIQYKLQTFDWSTLDTTTHVILVADWVDTTNFSINNCVCYELSPGKYILWCTSGTANVRRAQIIKTLFYGTTGANPRISSTYISGLTELKTSVSADVGKQVHYAQIISAAATSTYTGTFANTTTNTACQFWSYCYVDANAATNYAQFEAPSGTVLNSYGPSVSQGAVDETGTDTSADNLNNPATCQLEVKSGSAAQDQVTRAIILCTGDITWVESGSNGGVTNTDFYSDLAVPLFTAVTESLPSTQEDSGWLSCGITPKISSFTAFTNPPAYVIVKLIPKSSSPLSGYPSIYGFFVRAE